MAITLVSSVEVGSGGAASISFTNIPQTGKDLMLLANTRNTGGSGGAYQDLTVNINSSGINNSISSVWFYGNGSGVTFSTANGLPLGFNNHSVTTANIFSNNNVIFANYIGSTNKVFMTDTIMEYNATGFNTAYAALFANEWANTAAITSLVCAPGAGNFAQYSIISLYIIS